MIFKLIFFFIFIIRVIIIIFFIYIFFFVFVLSLWCFMLFNFNSFFLWNFWFRFFNVWIYIWNNLFIKCIFVMGWNMLICRLVSRIFMGYRYIFFFLSNIRIYYIMRNIRKIRVYILWMIKIIYIFRKILFWFIIIILIFYFRSILILVIIIYWVCNINIYILG